MHKLKRYLYSSLFIVITLIGYFLYSNIIEKPFPFVKIKYIYKENSFNANPTKLPIDITIPMSKFDKQLLIQELNISKNLNDIKKIKLIVKYVRKTIYLQRGSFKIRHNIKDILDKKNRYLHICSEAAKIFSIIAQVMGYPARVIWMNGHTTAEIFINNKWILVDPYFNVMFKSNNKYLSLLETIRLLKEHKAFPIQIIKPLFKENPDFNKTPSLLNVYKNQHLFIVLSGKNILNIDIGSRNLRKILNYFFTCKEPIAVGMEYVIDYRVGNNCLLCYLGICK